MLGVITKSKGIYKKPELDDEERMDSLFLNIVFTSILPILIAYFAHYVLPHKCLPSINIICSVPVLYFFMYLFSVLVYFSAYVKFEFHYIARRSLKNPSIVMVLALVFYLLTFILSLIPSFLTKAA